MDINVNVFVERYYAAMVELESSPARRERVEFARGQASAYLWGRMDSGEQFDPLVCDAFSWAYGTMHALLEIGAGTHATAIREAWESFKANGEILGYTGAVLSRDKRITVEP